MNNPSSSASSRVSDASDVGYVFDEAARDAFFRRKYGDPESTGWSPRRRFRHGYFTAGDRYEMMVERLVHSETRWVDVGGGKALFPNNRELSERLSRTCRRLVAVDPSENVRQNPYCHASHECLFEEVETDERFDLATFRMVAEHVEHPATLMAALAKVVVPGGLVVVYTINKYSPVPILTRVLPFSVHFAIKRVLWGGKEEDTFPVQYKMNSRSDLDRAFLRNGFAAEHFERLDDLSVFINFKMLNWFELSLWRVLNRFGLHYPEHNLLAVYRRV